MKKVRCLAFATLVSTALFCQKKWAISTSSALTWQSKGGVKYGSSDQGFAFAVGVSRIQFDKNNTGISAGLLAETRRFSGRFYVGGLGGGCTFDADFQLFYLRFPLTVQLPIFKKQAHFLLEVSPNWLLLYDGAGTKKCFTPPNPDFPQGINTSEKSGLTDGFVGSELAVGAGFRFKIKHGFLETVLSSTMNGPVLASRDWVAFRLGFGRFLGK